MVVGVFLGVMFLAVGLVMMSEALQPSVFRDTEAKQAESCPPPAPPESLQPEMDREAEAVPFQPLAVINPPPEPPPFRMSQPAETFDRLVSSNPISRALDVGRHVSAAKGVVEILDLQTQVIHSQAEQVKTVLRGQGEINDFQDREKLRPLDLEVDISARQAMIAENEEKVARSRKTIKDLDRPPVQEAGKQAEDPIERLERQWRAGLKDITGAETLYNRMLAEIEEEYNENPEMLRIQKEALDKLYKEKLRK
jgi:hypothetical protein